MRPFRIGVTGREDVAGWIERYQQLWDARFAALDDVVEELPCREQLDERGTSSEPTMGRNPVTVERTSDADA